jgi:hypothetical protein
MVVDLNHDGLNDLVILDTEGYLSFFKRKMWRGELRLQPGRRIFYSESGKALRLNTRSAGGSGRRKLALADWDGDGRLDLLANGFNVDFMRNIGNGKFVYQNQGRIAARKLSKHSTCPAVVDWDRNGIPDLVIGAEDGFLYYVENPRAKE